MSARGALACCVASLAAACGDGERAPWPSENPQQVAAAGEEVAFAYVAGVPVVAYRDGGAVRVARAVSPAPGGAEHWVVHELAGDGTGRPELIDVDGRAWVAYSDGEGALHVARAVVEAPATAGDWDDVVVDASGAQPSLAYRALVAGARRHTIGLAFYDPAGGDARYAWTSSLEPAAGDWTAVTVDAGGDTGVEPELELYLDGDLRVAIAYYDATAGDLRYARAARTGQPASPSDWDVVTLDGDGDVGRGAQLVGAGNQRTTFVYRDDSAGELVYLAALTDDAGVITVDRRYPIARGTGARLLSVGSRPVVVHIGGDGELAVTRAAGFAPADASEWATVAVGESAHAVAVAPPPCGLEDVDGVGRVELAIAYAGDGGLRFRYLTVEPAKPRRTGRWRGRAACSSASRSPSTALRPSPTSTAARCCSLARPRARRCARKTGTPRRSPPASPSRSPASPSAACPCSRTSIARPIA